VSEKAHLRRSHMRQTLTCVALFIGTAMTNGAKHQEIVESGGDGERRDWAAETCKVVASNYTLRRDITG
jgi:hypothetical protein